MLFVEKVCRAFNRAKLPYAIVGGYAVALHGAVRGTVDIDCVICWNQTALRRAESALNQLGLESRLPLTADDVFAYRNEYVRNRNLVAWNFYNPKDLSEQVDIVINYDLTGQKTDIVVIGEEAVRILSRQALIDMKAASGRPQDLLDIEALEMLV